LKSILIFLIIISSLYADGNRTIPPEICIDNVMVVAKQGWSNAKEPLRNFFQTDGKEYIESFLKNAEKPLTKADTADGIIKINVTRDEYFYALAYSKFLESQGRTRESLNIYGVILKGLNQLSLNDAQIMGFIYRMVIQEIVVDSLRNSVKHNRYTTEQKEELYELLSKNLLLDSNAWSIVLEADRKSHHGKCAPSLAKDLNTKYIFYPYDKSFLADPDVKRNVAEKICARIHQKQQIQYKKIEQISNEQEMEDFEKTVQEDQKRLLERLNDLKNKSPEEIEKIKSDQDFFIEILSAYFTSTSMRSVIKTKLDWVKEVESNKKFLQSLQETPTPNKSLETNQKPAGGFLIAHFKRCSFPNGAQRGR